MTPYCGGSRRTDAGVRVLGVDDWAWRKKKRQNYGTMVMDLEQRKVIDLLAVRSAPSFADWLRMHPEVEMITRDRSGPYADGGRQGAPAAVQITDRYHLMSNLVEAVERDTQLAATRTGTGCGPEKTPWTSQPCGLPLNRLVRDKASLTSSRHSIRRCAQNRPAPRGAARLLAVSPRPR